ncbi:MAG: hypothetical protein H6619_03355 [Deltaproteobacteria bacterium]|nr:hypothetical protein [Deltaproteobacteria bacterium]
MRRQQIWSLLLLTLLPSFASALNPIDDEQPPDPKEGQWDESLGEGWTASEVLSPTSQESNSDYDDEVAAILGDPFGKLNVKTKHTSTMVFWEVWGSAKAPESSVKLGVDTSGEYQKIRTYEHEGGPGKAKVTATVYFEGGKAHASGHGDSTIKGSTTQEVYSSVMDDPEVRVETNLDLVLEGDYIEGTISFGGSAGPVSASVSWHPKEPLKGEKDVEIPETSDTSSGFDCVDSLNVKSTNKANANSDLNLSSSWWSLFLPVITAQAQNADANGITKITVVLKNCHSQPGLVTILVPGAGSTMTMSSSSASSTTVFDRSTLLW